MFVYKGQNFEQSRYDQTHIEEEMPKRKKIRILLWKEERMRILMQQTKEGMHLIRW